MNRHRFFFNLLMPAFRALLLGTGVILSCAAGAAGQTADRIAASAGQGPDVTYRIERMGPESVLRLSGVLAIAEDDGGYLWFATSAGDGLFRYDGYSVTHYLHAPDDSTTLGSNRVEALYVDRSGTLWAGTLGGGLSRFDPRTETFLRFRRRPGDPNSLSQDSVTAIVEDQAGSLWIGTPRGLNRIDPSRQRIERFSSERSNPNSLSCDAIRVLLEDRDGRLWIGTGSRSPMDTPGCRGGLHRWDPEAGNFVRYATNPADPAALVDGNVQALFEDSRGGFWVGTSRYGLHEMDRLKGSFLRRRMTGGLPARLQLPYKGLRTAVLEAARTGTCGTRECGAVTALLEDRWGGLWVGDNPGGVTRFDLATGERTVYDLDDPRVWTVHEARDGSLWVGGPGPLYKLMPNTGHFRRVAGIGAGVTSLVEDAQRPEVLWAGTESGDVIRAEDDSVRRITAPFADTALVAIRSLASAGKMLLVGSDRGLHLFDTELDTWTAVSWTEEGPGGASSAAQTILSDSQGLVWVGVQNGLLRYDPESGAQERVSLPEGETPDSSVTALMADSRGLLWIGSPAGPLFSLDRRRRRFRGRIPVRGTRGLVEDETGRLWLVSGQGRLLVVDRKTEEATPYPLPEGRIRTLVGDASGRLWMAQENHLLRLDPETGATHSYDPAGEEEQVTFVPAAGIRRTNGDLVFATRTGLLLFTPADFYSNPVPPIVHITRVGAPDDAIHPSPTDPGAPGERVYADVSLPHDENDLTFEFVGLHYLDPASNRYRYKLENFDKTWYEAGTQRSARYAQLPPGRYVFRVQAANRDGRWSDEGAAIGVIIRPPWWQSNLALFLYGVFLVGLLAMIDRSVRQRVATRARERARQREMEQEREIERAREELRATQVQLAQQEVLVSLGELAAGVARDIRDPLQTVRELAGADADRIESLLAQVRGTPEPETLERVRETLAELREHAAQIAQLGAEAGEVAQTVIVHTDAESGRATLRDVNELVQEYVSRALSTCQAAGREVEPRIDLELDPEAGAAPVVAADIGRVLLHLLSNAFDAVDERQEADGDGYEQRIVLSTRRTESAVEIRLEDNGLGIPRPNRGRLFERFFSTKPPGKGTGLGLAVSYEIVTKGHGGTLTFETPKGGGAVFVVSLPLRAEPGEAPA